MQSSRLLLAAAAGSLLVVAFSWHVLESEESIPDLLVPTTRGNSSREFSQEKKRPFLRASYVVEAHQAVKTASASNADSFYSAPAPSAISPAYRPPVIAAVTRSIPSALPADRSHSNGPVQDEPSRSAPTLPGVPAETEFVPLYPPVHMGRVNSGPLILDLEPGVKVPAAVLDNNQPLAPAQAKAKDLVTEQFADEIANASEQPTANKPSNAASDVSEAAWLQARRKADERYRALLGDEAYNRATMQASLEAKGKAPVRAIGP